MEKKDPSLSFNVLSPTSTQEDQTVVCQAVPINGTKGNLKKTRNGWTDRAGRKKLVTPVECIIPNESASLCPKDSNVVFLERLSHPLSHPLFLCLFCSVYIYVPVYVKGRICMSQGE